MLSSFLDNAPTYRFTAGGDAATLMTRDASTLAAISAGAVFMGANTYIGNAPNLMVKAHRRKPRRAHAGLLRFHGPVGVLPVPLFPVMTLIFHVTGDCDEAFHSRDPRHLCRC